MNANDSTFLKALQGLLTEIFDGPPEGMAFILNPGDPGLLRQLDGIDAAAASKRPMPGATTVAAHTDHIHYSLSLLNRWIAGEENPWATSDWTASWKRTTVTPAEWQALRGKLRDAAEDWQKGVAGRQDWDGISSAGALSSAAHTAYHLGAIRQILAAMKLHDGSPA